MELFLLGLVAVLAGLVTALSGVVSALHSRLKELELFMSEHLKGLDMIHIEGGYRFVLGRDAINPMRLRTGYMYWVKKVEELDTSANVTDKFTNLKVGKVSKGQLMRLIKEELRRLK